MSDEHENPMIAEGQAQMIRQERIPQEEEREERPESCEECKWMTANLAVSVFYCGHPFFAPSDRSLPPSLKGKPPDWCPWEEE